MRCEALDKDFFAEIRDLNVAFLGLVADPRAGERRHLRAWRCDLVPAHRAAFPGSVGREKHLSLVVQQEDAIQRRPPPMPQVRAGSPAGSRRASALP